MSFRSEFSPPPEQIPAYVLDQIDVLESYANGSRVAIRREKLLRIRQRAIYGLATYAMLNGYGEPKQLRD